jgi:hypothetical protein
MTLHVLRAALQWALFLPLRVFLILLGFLVVPAALPFLSIEGPPIAFTQAPGLVAMPTAGLGLAMVQRSRRRPGR